jgi:uncharacterized membrane protein YbhN (UPF0104 family)
MFNNFLTLALILSSITIPMFLIILGFLSFICLFKNVNLHLGLDQNYLIIIVDMYLPCHGGKTDGLQL